MKCWTRYMLPLITVLCVFWGIYFLYLEVDAAESNEGTIDYGACITECESLASFIEKVYGDTFYYIGSYNSLHVIDLFISSTPFLFDYESKNGYSNFYCDTSMYHFRCESDFSECRGFGSLTSGSQPLLFSLSTAFSNHDIFYRDTGKLFFHQPSPFQRAVRGQDWAAVMTEILIILPLSIVSLTFLIGLRKGLRHILTFLRRA